MICGKTLWQKIFVAKFILDRSWQKWQNFVAKFIFKFCHFFFMLLLQILVAQLYEKNMENLPILWQNFVAKNFCGKIYFQVLPQYFC